MAEQWEIIDKNGKPTGRLHQRGNPMPKDGYHLEVWVLIENSKGEYLISQRTPNKTFPNMWECTGGSAVAGDDSLATALKEVQEELGIILDPKNGRKIRHLLPCGNPECRGLVDVWLFQQDVDISTVVLAPDEVSNVKWASRTEINRMIDAGTFTTGGIFANFDELLNGILPEPKRLQPGATIGIFCPSHVADTTRYTPVLDAIKHHGFRLKLGENFHKSTYGYAASAEERAADLNALVADESVQMIMFNGGNSAVEILPYIDYENIRNNPKFFCSYSDGTPILNAIHAQTGLVTYHGMCVSDFHDMLHYNHIQFCAHFMEGHAAASFISDSQWRTITGGKCEGTLVGGYNNQFGLLLSNEYWNFDQNKKYLLFLEDHEKFHGVGAVATYLAYIGQSRFMRNVTGLIFGHYATNVPQTLLDCLKRFGEKHNIPVVYTDDFGHGTKHGILPIGVHAQLDADGHSLIFA